MMKHIEVHTRLRPGGDWAIEKKGPRTAQEWVEVEIYMELFERIKILIDFGIMDFEIFKRLYGYRVINIFANPIILEKIR